MKTLQEPDDDPGLLRNILTEGMTEEDHEQARQWVMNLITEPTDASKEQCSD